MSNQIRPLRRVVDVRDAIVLEIRVESAVDDFIWVVLDSDGEPCALREMQRQDGDEFSVTIQPEDVKTASALRTVPLASSDFLLPEGDYRLRLHHGKVRNDRKTFAGKVGRLDVLDEDAFSVTGMARGADHPSSEGSDVGEPLRVSLVKEGPEPIRPGSSPVTFETFQDYLRREDVEGGDLFEGPFAWPAYGSGPYTALRNAARRFVATSQVRQFTDLIPQGYLRSKLQETRQQYPRVNLPAQGTVETAYLPGVELIWNYWLEEGGLVQTLHVILARFQNRRLRGRNPLERFDVTPLLPLRNKLWGYAEDEVHRMTVRRRAVEYEYEYGFPMIGRAIPRAEAVVERRSGFLEAFHQVLFLAHQYFRELDDLTVQADPFPLYRALRDCHIVLSQGTQNQYGEMAVAARAEFLVMQSILAEPQMREFLGGRPMTPYPEPWMDRVDAMKSIQGWSDASIMHFNDLATLGEQLVLTMRLGAWAEPGVSADEARSWAQAFRPAIQQYAAAYRSVTGVDLAREANATPPAVLLARRAANRARA